MNRNHKYFLMFIFSTMLAVIYLGVLAFISKFLDGNVVIKSLDIGEMDVVDKYSLIKWSNTDLLFGIKEGVCAVNIILMLIFGVPLM